MEEQPPRKSSPVKWILLGCGCITVGGIAAIGLVTWFGLKMIGKIGDEGAAYLRAQPEVVRELGTLSLVERRTMPMDVQIRNDSGSAYFEYVLTGSQATGEAKVWMTLEGGKWRGTGIVLTTSSGKRVDIGQPGTVPASTPKSD